MRIWCSGGNVSKSVKEFMNKLISVNVQGEFTGAGRLENTEGGKMGFANLKTLFPIMSGNITL